jgi:hypothetical protein
VPLVHLSRGLDIIVIVIVLKLEEELLEFKRKKLEAAEFVKIKSVMRHALFC